MLYPVGVSSLRTALSLTENQVSQIVNKSAFKSFTNSTKAADLFRSDLAFKLHIFNDLLSLSDVDLANSSFSPVAEITTPKLNNELSKIRSEIVSLHRIQFIEE